MSANTQEQLEAKDRVIQKLAASSKEKDNLLAVNNIYPLSLLFQSKKYLLRMLPTNTEVFLHSL